MPTTGRGRGRADTRGANAGATYDVAVTLRVVGAGLGRTCTSSLKLALERLLEGRCHHMSEVLADPERHLALWAPVLRGEEPDWDEVFAGFVAQVDFPGAAFWPEISRACPDGSPRPRSRRSRATSPKATGRSWTARRPAGRPFGRRGCCDAGLAAVRIRRVTRSRSATVQQPRSRGSPWRPPPGTWSSSCRV